ncbi:hypothetical protein HYC85_000035 [Camellia sinensis]|uniref:Uncharacterized protein n=1 Tax=Camellia sinensis TaxID=4442 RepID=A0A7J7FPI9_CAMSI|nr:hypothetical protein HYC85_000035 [Camellia sinensis]
MDVRSLILEHWLRVLVNLNSTKATGIGRFENFLLLLFERGKAQKLAAHRRAVHRIVSKIAEHSRTLQEIKIRSVEETEKMKATGAELSNLRKVRQASVALNVWQPEVVRGRHKQIVEQCVVPADSRIHALERELRLCKQLTGLDKAYRDEKRRLNAAKEQFASVKYYPCEITARLVRVDECCIRGRS